MKRFLFLSHRWLGITLCLFMAMWFFSGVVMMYVGYPKLTALERQKHLPALDTANCIISLGDALKAAGVSGSPKEMRMTSVASRPRYIMTFDREQIVAVDAQSGRKISAVSAFDAMEAASAFAGGKKTSYLGMIREDAWTHSKALDPHRPLHQAQVEDEDSTVLYVSSRTGEVVRDATRTERIWNWAGSWIHWLYPFRGGMLDKQWRDIVIYSSLAATVLALSGLVTGIMRWRIKGRYSNHSKSPYRKPFMRWHHLLGLLFGLLVIAWILSGLMSMNPWKLFDSGANPLDEPAFSGGAIEPGKFQGSLHTLLENADMADERPRELEWRMFDGKGYLIAHDGSGHTQIFPAAENALPFQMFPLEQLKAAGARLIPGSQVKHAEILNEYDFYYYARAPHTMSGPLAKRLPILRLKFDDPDLTWVHLDPYTGSITGKLDSHQRVKRWIFALLHSWDWLPLLERRPLWDIILILGSTGGFLISCTGIVIGWRRLQRRQKTGNFRKQPEKAAVPAE